VRRLICCPDCGSMDVREINNLHSIWQCYDCGYQGDGEEFDPEMPGAWEDDLEWADSGASY